jgi:hypothetical protein
MAAALAATAVAGLPEPYELRICKPSARGLILGAIARSASVCCLARCRNTSELRVVSKIVRDAWAKARLLINRL